MTLAGDLNNDGVNDIAVGAQMNDESALNAGKVYVFSGVDGDTLLTATGDHSIGDYGVEIASAGDINGDGYDDLIVGAPGFSAPEVDSGHAYVYSGQTGQRLYKITGEKLADRLGRSVGGNGDINNDGISDFVMGATRNDEGGDKAGRVYVFYGDTSTTTQNLSAAKANLYLTGRNTLDRFGRSVSIVPDLNADGHDELVISAHLSLTSGRIGEVNIFSGIDTTILHTFVGENFLDEYGKHFSINGDLNKDGVPDILIGAHHFDKDSVDAGRTYAYLLGDSDQDEILNDCDNCPNDFNPDQIDSDSNGIGDVCEPSCCAGSTGNVDNDGGVDIADLTFLIDHLFINFPELDCPKEGNVDADGGVDIADLTLLIDHLFINFPDLPACP